MMRDIKWLDLERYGYDRIVQIVTKKFISKLGIHFPSQDVEDYFQEAQIAYLEAADRYDAGQAASLDTYTSIRVSGSLLDNYRKHLRQDRATKKKPLHVSLDEPALSDHLFLGDEEADTELLLEDLEPLMFRVLHPREHISIRLAYLSSPCMTTAAIGDLLGIPESTIRHSIRNGIAKLRSKLNVSD